MERFLMEDLYRWKDQVDRKPLIVRGARQVGKTWLMKEFGHRAYRNVVYINFEREKRLHDYLGESIDPRRILLALQLISGQEIIPGETLVILDEIQEEPRMLSSLKYFYEEVPEYAIVCAGSLMGAALHKETSFPVGKVNFLDLYPLNFREFLMAIGESSLETLLKEHDGSLITAMKSRFKDFLRLYYYIGGMPEVVKHYAESGNLNDARERQLQLIDLYRQDFSKHAPTALIPRLNQVWDSVPGQLAKENRKYIYGQVAKGARAKDFELAIQWLSDCGLIHLVHRVTKPGIPLKFYEELSAFKIFLLDVGLFGAMSELPITAIVESNRLFEEGKGALTEQYVLQQFISDMKKKPYYYSAESSRGEIDFLIQGSEKIWPVEVKAEENLQAKSLKAYVAKYSCSQAIRISMSDYREQDWLVNLPLYGFTQLWPSE